VSRTTGGLAVDAASRPLRGRPRNTQLRTGCQRRLRSVLFVHGGIRAVAVSKVSERRSAKKTLPRISNSVKQRLSQIRLRMQSERKAHETLLNVSCLRGVEKCKRRNAVSVEITNFMSFYIYASGNSNRERKLVGCPHPRHKDACLLSNLRNVATCVTSSCELTVSATRTTFSRYEAWYFAYP